MMKALFRDATQRDEYDRFTSNVPFTKVLAFLPFKPLRSLGVFLVLGNISFLVGHP